MVKLSQLAGPAGEPVDVPGQFPRDRDRRTTRGGCPGATPGEGRLPGRRVERSVGGEDLLVQAPKRSAWLDAEFLGQHCAGGAELGQRIGLPAGPVQRQHDLAAESLAQRMLADQAGQLGRCLLVTAQGDHHLDPLLDRAQPQLGQARLLDGCPRAGNARQRSAVPQIQGGVQRSSRGLEITVG
jgi:hypothetical protein